MKSLIKGKMVVTKTNKFDFIFLVSIIFVVMLCTIIGLTITISSISQRIKEEKEDSSEEWWTESHTAAFLGSIIGLLTIALLGMAFINRKMVRELENLQLRYNSLLESFKKKTL